MRGAAEQPAGPAELSAAAGQANADRRDRRIYVWWAVALTLLALLGVFCWAVVAPAWEVRQILGDGAPHFVVIHLDDPAVTRRYDAAVRRLGGPRRAARALSLYSRLPAWIGEDRDWAVYLLGWCDSSAVPALARALRDRDEHVRWMAALALCQLGPEAREALPALTGALKDEDELVRAASAVALGQLEENAGQAVPALTEALRDPDERVRADAAEALKKIRGEKARR